VLIQSRTKNFLNRSPAASGGCCCVLTATRTTSRIPAIDCDVVTCDVLRTAAQLLQSHIEVA
jgi:hypothetical protein